MAPGELASQAGAAAAELRRSAAVERVVAALSPAAADRGLLGDRGAARAARRGAARRALPAAGRRLRRELRRLRVRPDRAEAQDPAADEPGAAARTEEADRPRRPHGGPVRQAALRRHRDARRRDAAELPRRLVNRAPFTPPRRASRIRSCCCAATSAPRSRSTSCARWSTAASPTCTIPSTGTWASCTTRRCSEAYQRIVDSIGDSLDFFESISGQPVHESEPRRVLRQPRGAAPALRAGADALHPAPAALVQPLDAHAVDRHAHRAARRRARRVSSAASPIRSASRSARAWMPSGCRALVQVLNPQNEPGRLTLIHRFGAKDVERQLAAADRGGARAPGQTVLWVLRPDARQHRDHRGRLKTRRFENILERARAGVPHPRASWARSSAACTSSSPARTSPSASAARAA